MDKLSDSECLRLFECANMLLDPWNAIGITTHLRSTCLISIFSMVVPNPQNDQEFSQYN
jgi:hypothetical protein